MRLAILLGASHGSVLTLLAGPSDPHSLNQEFKRLTVAPGDLAEIQLWTSSAGMKKRKRFPADGSAPAADDDLKGSFPTFEEVIAAGYKPLAALLLIARETVILEAQSDLSDAEVSELVKKAQADLKAIIAEELGVDGTVGAKLEAALTEVASLKGQSAHLSGELKKSEAAFVEAEKNARQAIEENANLREDLAAAHNLLAEAGTKITSPPPDAGAVPPIGSQAAPASSASESSAGPEVDLTAESLAESDSGPSPQPSSKKPRPAK